MNELTFMRCPVLGDFIGESSFSIENKGHISVGWSENAYDGDVCLIITADSHSDRVDCNRFSASLGVDGLENLEMLHAYIGVAIEQHKRRLTLEENKVE